ncbi:helix-turn-helix domain-containing protein [Novosphingobium sp. G106]|uniref:GlxA family transcriptional regulator n=1 Tax=Novosphingobium sp. G106 TaxID=2849500 RepID=UPI001C2D75FF|nr:helix-turn-helix domain-containing protein [Novosphingobium sp. G106]MBV1688955.1 helix-turn-helix domain-containing protein [Novosphingobium sp. G106]
MLDAHARMGEAFVANPALGNYASMHTSLRLTCPLPGPLTLSGGRRMGPDCPLSQLDDVRLIYLPSFQIVDPDMIIDNLRGMEAFHAWLRARGEDGVLIGACGASVFHLAVAGLLADRHVTLHPRLVTTFRKLFPAVPVDHIDTMSVSGRIMTCGPDSDNPALVLRLLGEAFSIAVAQSLALREPSGRPGQQSEYALDPVVLRAQLWIRERFTRTFRIADLAMELGVSHQALIRRFRAAGADTPRAFAQQVRVDSAASMLLETNRSITEIAQLVGYADVASFRQVFMAKFGMNPSAYRASRRTGAALGTARSRTDQSFPIVP